MVLIGIGDQHGLSQSNSWIGSAGHGEPQPSSIDERAAYVDTNAKSSSAFFVIFVIFHLDIWSIQARDFRAQLRLRKDSVSTRIAIPVLAAAPCRSPRRPISTNAAVPAMLFTTPVRHPNATPVRLAGHPWRGDQCSNRIAHRHRQRGARQRGARHRPRPSRSRITTRFLSQPPQHLHLPPARLLVNCSSGGETGT